MTEPWNFTEAQRRQFREAHAGAKRKSMDELLHDPRGMRYAQRTTGDRQEQDYDRPLLDPGPVAGASPG